MTRCGICGRIVLYLMGKQRKMQQKGNIPMQKQKFFIYIVWYGDIPAYVGQTVQPVEQRMRQHFLYDRDLDSSSTTRIQFAKVQTEADMNIYEMYYMNKLRTFENRIGKAKDEPTVILPELCFADMPEKELGEVTGNGGTHRRTMPKGFTGTDERF